MISSPTFGQVFPSGPDITLIFTSDTPIGANYVDYYWDRGATGYTDYSLTNNLYSVNIVLPNNRYSQITGPNVLHVLVKGDTSQQSIIAEYTIPVTIS